MTVPDGGECDIGGEEEEEADEGKEGDDQGGQVQAWKYKHDQIRSSPGYINMKLWRVLIREG